MKLTKQFAEKKKSSDALYASWVFSKMRLTCNRPSCFKIELQAETNWNQRLTHREKKTKNKNKQKKIELFSRPPSFYRARLLPAKD